MKGRIFLYLLAIIAMPLLVGMALVDWVNVQLRGDKVQSVVFAKLNEMIDHSTYHDLVFLGSSRTMEQVDPKIIDQFNGIRSFNGGMYGANILYSEMLLRCYLAHHRRPRLVVLDIDTLSLDTDINLEQYLPYYFPYLENDIVFSSLSALADPRVELVRKMPVLALPYYGDEILSNAFASYRREHFVFGAAGMIKWVAARKNPQRLKGFFARGEEWRPDADAVLDDCYINRQTAKGFEVLERLILMCKGQNIPIVLAFYPVYRDYHRIVVNSAELIENLTEVAKRHNVRFLRYDGISLGQTKANFYKYDHLNSLGAEKFSRILAEDIKKLNLLGANQ